MNQGMVICYPLICIIPTLYRSYSPECQAKTLPLHIVIDMNMGIDNLTYIIHSGFISGYQNRYGDNLKPPTNVYHRMTA